MFWAGLIWQKTGVGKVECNGSRPGQHTAHPLLVHLPEEGLQGLPLPPTGQSGLGGPPGAQGGAPAHRGLVNSIQGYGL